MMNKTAIYRFPTWEDRQCAEMALTAFLQLQNGLSRNIMLGALKAILKRYRLKKLNLTNCIVELTAAGDVIIKPKKFTREHHCPHCGNDLYSVDSKVRILSICPGNNTDVVTYGCQCGEIFGKVEPAFNKE